jgi:hypothetical protein
VKILDIQATITSLDNYADHLKVIRARAARFAQRKDASPEMLSQIAYIKRRLERAFEAGIAISEILLEDIPSLQAHPAQLAHVLEAQSRLGEESDQIMIILERFDLALMDPAATRH